MWLQQSVSVVLMTYAERDSIREVIQGFLATGVVDEVVVVNNNAERGTTTEVDATEARQVFESNQGYGHATRRGLAEASGDLIVLCEPDGTFSPEDIFKFLAYSDQCDAVFGTRTTRNLVWKDANMGPLLAWGNRLVASYLGLLYRTGPLTDVGCTYKLFRRRTVDFVLPHLRIGGSQLGPELMIQTILSGARYVEIPVNYRPRIGTSSVTGHLLKAIVLGVQMVLLITRLRLRSIGRCRRVTRLDSEAAAMRPNTEPLARSTSVLIDLTRFDDDSAAAADVTLPSQSRHLVAQRDSLETASPSRRDLPDEERG